MFDKKSLSEADIRTKYITPAIKPGVSVAFNPARGQRSNDIWANSGYGLYMISEICKATGGWFTFVSGEGCLRAYPNNTRLYGAHFKGTALGIRVKTSNIGNHQALIDDVRTMGENTAKTIKNAFREASTPSRGLMFNQ